MSKPFLESYGGQTIQQLIAICQCGEHCGIRTASWAKDFNVPHLWRRRVRYVSAELRGL